MKGSILVIPGCILFNVLVEPDPGVAFPSGTTRSEFANRIRSKCPSPVILFNLMNNEDEETIRSENSVLKPGSRTRTITTALTRRRTLRDVVAASSATLIGGHLFLSLPAWALKPRNEQLCGTGFFTNYLEYRCTDIGDISDEGKKTTFSEDEAGQADALLSKLELNLNSDGAVGTEKSLEDEKKATRKGDSP
jgi:hypothetical protein